MNREKSKLRDALVVPLEEQAARLAEAYVRRASESEKNRESQALRAPADSRKERHLRGVFEKVPGSGEWWIRYNDSSGRFRREKAGSKSIAIKLVEKRRMEALQGRKLLRRSAARR